MYGIEGLLAGRTLVDRYRIQEVIGRGGMGAVYRARDQRLGRDVAVKVISVAAPDPEAHRRLRARFHREARAAAQLHHPNVMAVYDFGTDPVLGLDFLVMELLRGEDLATRLARKGTPAVPTAVSIVYQAACGLAAGHRAGLIHRDIKPGNLFLEPGDRIGDLRVKVLDFGIAEITASDEATITHLTIAGRSPFSPAFASPEQIRGEERVTPATDVFSLGAVAYQLLTGQRAFATVEPRQMLVELSAAVAALPSRAPHIPPALRLAVQRALAPHPEDRHPHAGALADALAPLLTEREGHLSLAVITQEPRRPRAAAEEPVPTDGQTRALTNGRAHPAHETESGTRLAEPRPELAPELQRLLERSAAAHPSAASPVWRPAARQGGWLRRAARAVWNFLVTTTAVGLYAGCWLAIISALQAGDLYAVYAGAAASVLITPFALHRVMGRRGSLGLAAFGSAVASLAAVYLVRDFESMELTLGALFLAQLTVSVGVERLTRPSPAPRLPDPHHTPGRA